jgi:hypothetical protein
MVGGFLRLGLWTGKCKLDRIVHFFTRAVIEPLEFSLR